MENRYTYLLKPGARYDDEEGASDENNNNNNTTRDSQDYAAFLRDQERKATKEGYVDSQKLQHNYTSRGNGSGSSGAGGDSSGKERKAKDKKDGGKTEHVTVIDLLSKKKKEEQQYDKRLKVIEEHMWQHKQDSRELKRVEGDIIKNQRQLRRSLRDYENAITRRRLAEEKKQSQQLEQYAVQQYQIQHKKEDMTKQRIEANLSTDQSHKDSSRKAKLVGSHLSRQYNAKVGELEVKRKEALRLSEDFESRLRRKEEEQFKLKQELAELAIALNMEAQKGRTQEDNYIRDQKKQQQKRMEENKKIEQSLESIQLREENDAKGLEQNRRKMSADLAQTRSHLQLKQREEERHRKDTNNRLRDNALVQKQLNDTAVYEEMEQRSREIDQKIQEHNQRRHILATQAQRQKKESTVQHEAQFSVRAQKRAAEQQRKEHVDHLKHFQKYVNKGEEIEYNLYNNVKNMEYARQKREQAVRRIQNKLLETQRENASKLKAEMLEAAQQEEELKQRLSREQASLAKIHAAREESYMALQKHRSKLRSDKYLLSEHEREHDRLTRITQKTEALSYS